MKFTDTEFLDAIAEEPDDDAFRLAYAEWLEKNGQGDRAEFIRIQCASWATSPREQALLEKYRRDWLGAYHHDLLRWHFRRGLPAAFSHSGIFQRTETVRDSEGWKLWSYLRFFANGTVMFLADQGTPLQVSHWFRRNCNVGVGHCWLNWTPPKVSLSFDLTAGYRAGFGLFGFDGTIVVQEKVTLSLEVHSHKEEQTTQQTYVLIDVPGYDTHGE